MGRPAGRVERDSGIEIVTHGAVLIVMVLVQVGDLTGSEPHVPDVLAGSVRLEICSTLASCGL